jgi:hypothetical protein
VGECLDEESRKVVLPLPPPSLANGLRSHEIWDTAWSSGAFLGELVLSFPLPLLKRVSMALELGAGAAALPSHALFLQCDSLSVPPEIIVTDAASEALEKAERSFKALKRHGVQVMALNFESPPPTCVSGRVDLALAADVLYLSRQARPLLGTIAAVLAPNGAALVVDPGRDFNMDAFIGGADDYGLSIAHHAELYRLRLGGVSQVLLTLAIVALSTLSLLFLFFPGTCNEESQRICSKEAWVCCLHFCRGGKCWCCLQL